MRGSIHDTPLNIYKQLMDVNFFGHVAITQKLLDAIPDDGCIIATSSVQGKLPIPYRSAYGASKHAFQAFFDALRCESRPNLHILTVSAGYMNTGFGSRALDAQGHPVGKEDEHQLKVCTEEILFMFCHVFYSIFQRVGESTSFVDFFSLVHPLIAVHVLRGSFQSGPSGHDLGSGTGKMPCSRSGLGTSSMR
ncbi:hypothetical protein ANCDUO_14773 [Ancylostoma duodenale]|uniref:Oxidoreductase, short chain dehydrogenase/reductase family protein n=1 Tax=Ancylostoma duodenale TaxID=51022 RepID=A0A0C2G871_9BILA|nr:hypothetical protein ANCDUO_14773 [Ancylostoma duodenale]